MKNYAKMDQNLLLQSTIRVISYYNEHIFFSSAGQQCLISVQR